MSTARSTTRKRSVSVGQLLLLPLCEDDEQPAVSGAAIAVLADPTSDVEASCLIDRAPDETQSTEGLPQPTPLAVFPEETTPVVAAPDRLDFLITNPTDLAEGGARTRIEANLEAIRLLIRRGRRRIYTPGRADGAGL
jgi:hypothetical protein